MSKFWKWILIVLGTVSWSWTMVKSGWIYSYGMGFWGANGHDGIWHIALIESLAKGTLAMPVFAGTQIQNYHIGFDLIVALIHRITTIPVVNLYFQIVPPILALLIGILTYQFVVNWTGSKKSAFWSTFFVYFGGSWAWLFGKGESAFWSQESVSTLINPPFAMSLVVMLLGMILLIKNRKKFFDYVLLVILFGILIEIKSYAGVLALGGLFLAALYRIFVSKKIETLFVFVAAALISLALYFPLNSSPTSFVIWQPFWFLETMVAGSDRFLWPKMAEAMLSYKAQHVIIKFIAAYSLVFAIFVLGNLGTRMIFLIRKIRKIGEMEIFSYAVILGGILIPTFFVQRATTWNTIQFLYYSLFISAILGGIVLGNFIEKSKLKKIVIYLIEIMVILLTIPTTLISLKDIYVPGRPPAYLPKEELSALSFLKDQPDGTVLTYPYDLAILIGPGQMPPLPLYIYDSTAYVSAFSAKPVYIEDKGNLDITGYNWPERLNSVETWYKETNQNKAREFLSLNKIKYIYWLKGQRAVLGEGQLGLKNIFENSLVIIYRVD